MGIIGALHFQDVYVCWGMSRKEAGGSEELILTVQLILAAWIIVEGGKKVLASPWLDLFSTRNIQDSIFTEN